MKKIILAGVTVAALGIMAMSPAEARDGCGPHRYRDWNGYCRWMRPPPPSRIIFGFYGGGFGGPGWHHGYGGEGWDRGWHHGWRRW